MKLERLLRRFDSKNVYICRHKIYRMEMEATLETAIQEEKEGRLTTYSNVDELFEDLGI